MLKMFGLNKRLDALETDAYRSERRIRLLELRMDRPEPQAAPDSAPDTEAWVNVFRNIDGSHSLGMRLYKSEAEAVGNISVAFRGNLIGAARLNTAALAAIAMARRGK